MITHLQRDLGLQYRRACECQDSAFRPADTFLFGLLHSDGGTCGSLPVLYAAVGRRMGYPIRLVTTRNHMLCRWHSDETFNIEASGEGVSFFSDEHYRTGRFALPAQTIADCGYLKSLYPQEESAAFLRQRGECWMSDRQYGEATISFACANELDPTRQQHMFLTRQAMTKWGSALRSRVPRGFPKLQIDTPGRRFSKMPQKAEAAFIQLLVTENLIKNEELEQRWWKPLRANMRPKDLPVNLPALFAWDNPVQITG